MAKKRLVNVRLDAERLRKAELLRERGVPLSDVVREAIDQRFVAVCRSSADAPALIAALFERHPDPSDLPPREYDVHDRHAARAAVVRAMRRRRR